LALRAQLDNKGYNTSIPGNCLQCHGINATYTITPDAQGNSKHEVKNAMFLPFDLDAFEYFSDDPNNGLSRAKQETAFRAHNRMVRKFSALGRSKDAQDLIEKWYADDLTDDGGEPFRSVVPSGWQGDAGQEQLYKTLVAVACRTCHISYVPFASDNRPHLTFGNATAFLEPTTPAERVNVEQARSLMCTTHRNNSKRMPAAEQTLKVLWRSAGRAQFFGQVEIPGPERQGVHDCGL
jgi:hypothetical protein